MEQIHIKIPDNLSPSEEMLAIAKQLGKRMLPAGKNKLLGSGYEIKHSETKITITREAVEKPIATLVCSVCKTTCEMTLAKPLWINYGGKTRKVHYCSDDCRSKVIEICGEGRASIKKESLGRLIKY